MRFHWVAGAALLASFIGLQDPSKESLRKKLKDVVHASWIYDDLPGAVAEARRSGKPVLALFRCIP